MGDGGRFLKTPEPEHPTLCALFHEASELIGRRWTGAIIFVLLRRRLRFAELRACIPGITDRMLSERLHDLEQEKIVVRTVVPETPVRVEYSLSEKGRALAPPLEAIAAWAHDWIKPPHGHGRHRDDRVPPRRNK
jgi:DNA-binding HxlR family transcriptional regulator